MINISYDIMENINLYLPIQDMIIMSYCNHYFYNKLKNIRIIINHKKNIEKVIIDLRFCFSNIKINNKIYKCRIKKKKNSSFCLLCNSIQFKK